MLVCLCLVVLSYSPPYHLVSVWPGMLAEAVMFVVCIWWGLPTSKLVQDIDCSEDYLGCLEFFKENPRVVPQIRPASVPYVWDAKSQSVSWSGRLIFFFFTLAQCICRSSAWNLLWVTIPGSKILMCLIDFWKFCAPLPYVFLSNPIAR